MTKVFWGLKSAILENLSKLSYLLYINYILFLSLHNFPLNFFTDLSEPPFRPQFDLLKQWLASWLCCYQILWVLVIWFTPILCKMVKCKRNLPISACYLSSSFTVSFSVRFILCVSLSSLEIRCHILERGAIEKDMLSLRTIAMTEMLALSVRWYGHSTEWLAMKL